jgi:hypothetical protein
MDEVNLRGAVFEALDVAWKENGYDQRRDDPEQVAIDLASYCSNLEDLSPERLLPHVRAWQEERR